jgi:threonine/homoserine/homoserine lactone efflux protein
MLAIGGIAFLGAVLSTLPAGPVNLLAIYYVLNRRIRIWRFFVAGILLADVGVCLLAMYLLRSQSIATLQSAKQYEAYLVWALIVSILALGVRLIVGSKAAPAPGDLAAQASESAFKGVLGGFVATALSPGLLFFWMTWWMKWFDDFSPFRSGFVSVTTALAICIGDFLVFTSYRYLALHFGNRILSRTSLNKINRGIGCLLILAALALILSI